jgi:hypothetical protein
VVAEIEDALGIVSSEFVYASLMQLIATAELPGGRISEMAVSASLALAARRDRMRSPDPVACTRMVKKLKRPKERRLLQACQGACG